MHLAPLIQDLAVILGVAAVVTFLFRLIKQPVVLGYIVAGMIVGPFGPPQISVIDGDGVKVWAELGVIFFMFALGLEFSFRRLAKVGGPAAITAAVQICALMGLGYGAARALGWTPLTAWFVGCMLCISSTTIILKTFAEAGLKTRRFAELVVGILVVEDLAAIVMLVALTNVATMASINGLQLLATGAKLGLVVGMWLLIGWFAVPRLVRIVAGRGSNEVLIVVALALCLALVTLSAFFHYSVALGAFIMGAILAETREVERIETLVEPFRDVFGAVFFVSVGMLLDPTVLVHHWGAVLLFTAVVLFGNTILVSAAALLTGQTLSTAVNTGFSLAQIGEFSFIIANLGLAYKVLEPEVYPIIVAVSLLSTFATPRLLQSAPAVVELLTRLLPARALTTLTAYGAWRQREMPSPEGAPTRRLLRWVANGVLVITLFTLSGEFFYPWLAGLTGMPAVARPLAWLLTFLACAPFLWGMLSAWRRRTASLLLSSLATVLLLGVLSLGFFPLIISAAATVCGALLLVAVFRRRIERYYLWFERTFVAGMAPRHGGDGASTHDHLAPWDGHLARIAVGPGPFFAGRTLLELQLRERFGLNIVVIKRGDEELVAPQASERVFPHDELLCFATDADLDKLHAALDEAQAKQLSARQPSSYALRAVEVAAASPFAGCTIRQAGIREAYDCIIVGIERAGHRIQSPQSDLALNPKDLLWVVGESTGLTRLQTAAGRPLRDGA